MTFLRISSTMDLQIAKQMFEVTKVSQEEKNGVGSDESWENPPLLSVPPRSHMIWLGPWPDSE